MPAIAVEGAFAFLIELGRKGTGQHLAPLHVEFTRSEPETKGHYAYFDCPILYGAPRNKLVLKSADLSRRFPGGSPEILEMLTPALTAHLVRAMCIWAFASR